MLFGGARDSASSSGTASPANVPPGEQVILCATFALWGVLAIYMLLPTFFSIFFFMRKQVYDVLSFAD